MLGRNYRKIGVKFNEGVKVVAEDIMHDACHEIRRGPCDVVDTGVSVDGTWQKRSFTSYNGSVAAISITTGKILDVEVMSRFCQGCIQIETFKTKDPGIYEKYCNDQGILL